MVGTLRYMRLVRKKSFSMFSNGDVPDPKTGKVEGIVLAISSSFSIGQAVRVRDANGWRDMVGKPLWRMNRIGEYCDEKRLLHTPCSSKVMMKRVLFH